MRMSIATLAAGLLIAASSAQAQNVFTVMSAKGNVEWSAGRSGKWKKVSVGQELHANDVVRTAFDSYCKLMFNSERLVSVDQKTVKPLADFVKQKARTASSASGSILQYVSDQMKSRGKSKDKDLDLGAVRGQFDGPVVLFPKYATLDTVPRFRWYDADAAGPYEFVLYDDTFSPIDKQEPSSQSATLPQSLPSLTAGKTYYWKVAREKDGVTSDIQTFSILTADSALNVRAEVARLDTDLAAMNADDVTHNLIKAMYFEKKGLYENAVGSYKRTIDAALALKMNPDEYYVMLRNLLRNLRFLNEEQILLK